MADTLRREGDAEIRNAIQVWLKAWDDILAYAATLGGNACNRGRKIAPWT
jgi:hypothetical protein